MEHRWGKRVTTNIPVRLIASGGTLGAGRVRDLSASGAFIETRLQLSPLTWVQLEPDRSVGGREPRARVAACVVRCTPDGVGVEWCDGAGRTAGDLCHAIVGGTPPDLPTTHDEPRFPVPGHATSAAPLQ